MKANKRPHILLIIARGEAVRNFVYSDTLPILSKRARVTLLSLVEHGEVIEHIEPYVDQVFPLREYRENRLTTSFRHLLHWAHFRWLWSANAQHMWTLHDSRARRILQRIQRMGTKLFAVLFAHRPLLGLLTWIDYQLSWFLRPTREFENLFQQLKPDLVFNCSHIHGPQADLPMRVAHHMKIPTAVFVFSWDNLTTRSRIFVPYDYYLMWNEGMKALLLDQYRDLSPCQIFVTGTPQFDFHFKPEYCLTRQELCARLGIDPKRPFILYTTGMDTDFLDEHKFIEAVIHFIREIDFIPKPQLVVRTYIKGTSPEIQALARKNIPDVVFPPILWDKQWIMPLREDLAIYSSLLHHCALGINAASTVTLELMALDKPIINIGMEPPGSNLPQFERFSRHIEYEHFRPVVASGGTMIARSIDDLREMIRCALIDPGAQRVQRKAFIHQMMNGTLDDESGRRVAEQLLSLADHDRNRRA